MRLRLSAYSIKLTTVQLRDFELDALVHMVTTSGHNDVHLDAISGRWSLRWIPLHFCDTIV